MRRRFSTSAVAGLLLSIAIAMPVAAGGWAALLPDAEQPPAEDGMTVIGFVLLQHGQTPVDFGETTVVATNSEDGTVVRMAAARAPGGDGRWTARLSLATGSWSYTVVHSELEILAPTPIEITAATAPGTADAGRPASTATIPGLALLAMVAAVALVTAAAIALHRRRYPAGLVRS